MGLQTTPCHAAPIGPTTEIFWKFGSTYLHVCTKQCVIKRKLQVYRAQKCDFLVGAKTVKGGAGLQTTPCHVMLRRIEPTMKIFGNSGLPIALVPCFLQSNIYMKRKLWVRRTQKFNLLVGAPTVPTGAGLQTTPCHTALYRANNGNLRRFWSAYRLGTVFSPKQRLH